jgi:hypothetical protein
MWKVVEKIMVQATEGCSINQGKYAKQVKSTKFENKFCRLASQHLKSSETCENFSKSMYDQYTRKIVNFVNLPWNFHAKRQGGGGWRFFKENVFIALIA